MPFKIAVKSVFQQQKHTDFMSSDSLLGPMEFRTVYCRILNCVCGAANGYRLKITVI